MRSKIIESKVRIVNVHGACVLHIAKLFSKWLY